MADFGIAKLDPNHDGRDIGIEHVAKGDQAFGVQAHIATSPGIRLGTPAYIPPEQAFGKPIDARSDLYSVGVLLFEMLTGHKPFNSDTERGLCLEHLHTAPKPVNSVNDALQIDPQIEMLLQAHGERYGRTPTFCKVCHPGHRRSAHRISPHSRTVPLPVVLRVKKRDHTVDEEPIELPSSALPQWAWGALAGMAVGGLIAALLLL